MYASLLNYPNSLFGQFQSTRHCPGGFFMSMVLVPMARSPAGVSRRPLRYRIHER